MVTRTANSQCPVAVFTVLNSAMKTKPKICCRDARNSFLACVSTSILLLALLGATWTSAQSQPPAREPDYNAPWPGAESKGVRPKSSTHAVAPAAAPKAQTPAAAPGAEPNYNAPWGATAPQPSAAPASPAPGAVAPGAYSAAPPMLRAPKSTKHEISVSGDLTMGQGQVTLPLGYSLKETLGSAGVSVPVSAFTADRSSIYYGGTVSYSYGQAWYIDLSFAHGESSGNQSIDTGALGSMDSDFKITDDWLQAYVRYTFPGLRGKRLSAYLRAGGTYVQADLKDDASSPAVGRYTQTDKTKDLLGNVGFGLGYSLYTTRRARFGIQFEGEGFFGNRTQDSLEFLSADEGLEFKSANISNTLYGGIGRATFRFEYRLGASGLFKIFADGGGQMRYTLVNYPDAGSSTELLWGPYIKLGVRYAF